LIIEKAFIGDGYELTKKR